MLLLRHAETSAPDRFHGAESDVDLGPRGREQARRIGVRLAALCPDAVVSSPMLRALQTAEAIASACGLPVEIVPDLHERRMGSLSGWPIAEGRPTYEEAKARWISGDLDFAADSAESYAQVRDRVVPALLSAVARRPGQTLVVVTHGVVLRVLLTSLVDGLGPRDFNRLGIGYVTRNDLRFDGQRWRVVARNEGWEDSEL